MNITVVGIGYVGLSNAILLAQNNSVKIVDIVEEKVNLINNKLAPIVDVEIEDYLANKELDLVATLDLDEALKTAEFVVIATPTNYDEGRNFFDTSSVDFTVKKALEINPKATIVVKSTVPVGYTQNIKDETGVENILFSPEFLREGRALYDNLYPSRIIVGANESMLKEAEIFISMLCQGALKENPEQIIVEPTEAEAIKLFSNTYLALRVSFFNELDTYAEIKGLNTKQIIDGVCLDPRIGNHYNNPSFGYGGYCLPKDTKQMVANYQDVPNEIINAIVESNVTRKEFIAKRIMDKQPKKIGVYRLIMKQGSDNFRESSIGAVIKLLAEENVEVVIYEPTLETTEFEGKKVIKSIEEFKSECDVILANRNTEELADVNDKVYTRDIYTRD